MSMLVRTVWLILAMMLLGACTLGEGVGPGQPLATPTDDLTGAPISPERPVVSILSPLSGGEVRQGDRVLVSARVQDVLGVTSVQLSANGLLAKTVPADTAAGVRNMEVVLDHTPRQTGTLDLDVVAFRGTVASAPQRVSLSVVGGATQVSTPLQPPVSGGTQVVIDPNDPTCRVLLNVGLNFRTGPGTAFERLSVLPAGAVVPISGRLGDNRWWQVRAQGTVGWVSGDFVTVYGNCLSIPVLNVPTAPVTSTPLPTLTRVPSVTPQVIAPLPTATPAQVGPANLTITAFSGPQTLSVQPGGAVGQYSVQIVNGGGSATGTFDSIITFQPTGAIVSLGAVSNLAPGETIVLQASVPFAGPGIYTLVARADANNQVVEANKDDNTRLLQVSVN